MSERLELLRAVQRGMSDIDNWPDDFGYKMLGVNMSKPQNAVVEAVTAAGFRKQRTVSTVDELDALLHGDANVALMDEDGMILQNLAGGWATPISTRFMTSETVHRGFGPDFTVIHEGGTL